MTQTRDGARRPRPLPEDTTARHYGTFRLSELVDSFALLRALCQRPHTLDELATVIGKTPRTVRRHVKALAYLRLPVESARRAGPGRSLPVRVWWAHAASVGAWFHHGRPPAAIPPARRAGRGASTGTTAPGGQP